MRGRLNVIQFYAPGDGKPATVLADPAVREVFLGTEVTAALAGGSLEAPPAAPGDGAADGERETP